MDILISGKVVSGADSKGIPSIRVSLPALGQYAVTAEDGSFRMFAERMADYRITASDTDGPVNGTFQAAETHVSLSGTDDSVEVLIEMD